MTYWKTTATHQYILLFIIVLILAIAGRVWKLGTVPVSLYWDEIAMLADARSIVATGRDMSNNHWLQPIYPSYGDYKLAPYILLSAPLTVLPVTPEFQIRMLSVFVGISTMCVGSILGYSLFTSCTKDSRRRIALAIFTTIAFSPWSIGFSRTAFEGHLAQLFFGISILLLLISSRRWLFFVTSGFFGALAVSTYYSVLYVWPVVLIITLAIVFIRNASAGTKNTNTKRQFVVHTLLLITTFAVFLTPLLFSPFFSDMQKLRLSSRSILDPLPFVEQSRLDRSISNYGVISRVLYTAKIFQFKQAVAQFSTNMSPSFLFLQGDPNTRHSSGYGGLFSIACLPVFLVGIYVSFRRQKYESLLLLSWWLVALVPASIPTELPHALRTLNALLPLSIFIGLGWAILFDSKQTWIKIVTFGLVLLFVVQTSAYLYHYFTVYPRLSALQWQDGYKQLAIEISKYSSEVDTAWVAHPDGRFFLWYITYGQAPPNLVQTAEKKWYEPTQLGNVYFKPLTASSIETLTVRTALVAEKNEMDSLLDSAKRTPEFSLIVPNSFGNSDIRFVIVEPSDQPDEYD